MAAGTREHLAQGEVQADVLGLQLEGLAIVEDRLVVLLGAGVDVGSTAFCKAAAALSASPLARYCEPSWT
jgi:hypothetical protein